MGECINVRRAVSRNKLPVLNANLPADAIVEYSGGVTLSVEISQDGNPTDYKYQWYRNGQEISSATNATVALNNLSTGTIEFYCKVTNGAGSIYSRTATVTVGSELPTYTYSGSHELIDDGDGNWRLKLKSSGDLTFTNRGTGARGVDIFLVGGGAGGRQQTINFYGGGGGGGGYTATHAALSMNKDDTYWIEVGAGGGSNTAGGTTSIVALNISVEGGKTGNADTSNHGGKGGSGGGGGGSHNTALPGNGGSDGSTGNSGRDGYSQGGAGQGTTTREFAESSGTLYAGGGAGGQGKGSNGVASAAATGGDGGGANSGESAIANTGGGGGGGNANLLIGGSGGSGIVIIRNKR